MLIAACTAWCPLWFIFCFWPLWHSLSLFLHLRWKCQQLKPPWWLTLSNGAPCSQAPDTCSSLEHSNQQVSLVASNQRGTRNCNDIGLLIFVFIRDNFHFPSGMKQWCQQTVNCCGNLLLFVELSVSGSLSTAPCVHNKRLICQGQFVYVNLDINLH